MVNKGIQLKLHQLKWNLRDRDKLHIKDKSPASNVHVPYSEVSLSDSYSN